MSAKCFNSNLGGDRLIFVVTNNRGSALSGINFSFGSLIHTSSTSYRTSPGGFDPSRGTFSGHAYASIANQRYGIGTNPLAPTEIKNS